MLHPVFFSFFFALLFIINQTILFFFLFRPNLRDSLRIPKGGLDDPPQRQGKRGVCERHLLCVCSVVLIYLDLR